MKRKKAWTRWTQRRLENLFQKYNQLYFGGSLDKWGASIGRPKSEDPSWVGVLRTET